MTDAGAVNGSSDSSSPFTGAGSSLGLRSRLAQQAAGVQDALDPPSDLTLHALHLRVIERRRAMKLGAGSRTVGQVDTIQHHGVEMNVGRERGPEALHEVDRAGVREAA